MKITSIPVALLLLLTVASSACNSSGSRLRQGEVRLLEGEYLSTSYIDELKKTQSPFRASDTNRIDSIIVHREGTELRLEPIFNLHEGGNEFSVSRDGLVSPLSSNVEGSINPNLTVFDEHTFEFGFGKFKPTKYVLVKNAADYVAKIVLVGTYKDRHGLNYKFQEDGWAIFPDRKFKYKIGVDHVLNNYDYFMDVGQGGKVWAFKLDQNNLRIFATSDEDGVEQIVNRVPRLSLSRVR